MKNNHKKIALTILLCIFTTLVGCGDNDEASTDDQSTTAVDEEVTTTAKEPEAKKETALPVLLEQGQTPRSALRFNFEEGTYSAEIEQRQTAEFSGIPGTPEGEIETGYITKVETAIKNDEEGFILNSQITDISSLEEDTEDEALVNELNRIKSSLTGIITESKVSATGKTLTEPKISGSEDLDPQLKNSLEQINGLGASLIFPTEEVGTGAIWTVTQDTEADGLTITQKTTYTIESINEPFVEIGIETIQTVDEGAVLSIPGQQASVKEWNSTNTGKITVDLTHPVPTSEATGNLLQIFETTDGSELIQKISTEITVSPTE